MNEETKSLQRNLRSQVVNAHLLGKAYRIASDPVAGAMSAQRPVALIALNAEKLISSPPVAEATRTGH